MKITVTTYGGAVYETIDVEEVHTMHDFGFPFIVLLDEDGDRLFAIALTSVESVVYDD